MDERPLTVEEIAEARQHSGPSFDRWIATIDARDRAIAELAAQRDEARKAAFRDCAKYMCLGFRTSKCFPLCDYRHGCDSWPLRSACPEAFQEARDAKR